MLFSILAFLALIISICIKDRKKSLYMQTLNCVCEAIYCYISFAYTGAILSIVNVIRSFLFVKKEKFSKRLYVIILILFESIIVLNCIGTWSGYISLLPTVGSIIRTFCLWQTNMKYVRISGVTTGILYGLYYLYYKSIFLTLGDIILIIVSFYAIYRHDIKKEGNV